MTVSQSRAAAVFGGTRATRANVKALAVCAAGAAVWAAVAPNDWEGWFFLALFGGGVGTYARSARARRALVGAPALVLDERGIDDRLGNGFVPWNEITRIVYRPDGVPAYHEPILGFDVHDRRFVGQRWPRLLRPLLRLRPRGLPQASITLQCLDAKPEEILAAAARFYDGPIETLPRLTPWQWLRYGAILLLVAWAVVAAVVVLVSVFGD